MGILRIDRVFFALHVIALGISFAQLYAKPRLDDAAWTELLRSTPYGIGVHFVNSGWRFIFYVVFFMPAITCGCFAFSENGGMFAVAGVLVVVATVLLAHTIVMWCFAATFSSWRHHVFPAKVDDTEMIVARAFNNLFCQAESTYICVGATSQELLSMNLSSVVTSRNSSSNSTAISTCLSRFRPNRTSVPDPWPQICATCGDFEPSPGVDKILNWTLNHCEFNSQTVGWCQAWNDSQLAIDDGNLTSEFQYSPYNACRGAYLGDMHHASFKVGGLFLGLCLCYIAALWLPYELHRESHRRPRGPRPLAHALPTPALPITHYEPTETPVDGKKAKTYARSESQASSSRSTALSSPSVSFGD